MGTFPFSLFLYFFISTHPTPSGDCFQIPHNDKDIFFLHLLPGIIWDQVDIFVARFKANCIVRQPTRTEPSIFEMASPLAPMIGIWLTALFLQAMCVL
ncbi:hypothetical protein B0H10DRAFT_2047253, partial [Mycena sp. CBHHK59/15]